MKKILWILCIIIYMTGCGTKIQNYQEITYNEYIEKIEKKESFVLFMWQTNCSHCQSFKPIFKKVIQNYGIENVYALNLDDLTDKEYAKLKNKTFISGTPTTVYIENGVTQTSPKIIGDKEENLIIKFFKKIEYIGED